MLFSLTVNWPFNTKTKTKDGSIYSIRKSWHIMWSFDWQTRVARGLKSIIWHVIIKFFTVFIKVAVISKLPACQILITHMCVSIIHKGPPPVGQTFLFFCSLWNFLNVIFLRGQSWRESNQRLHWSCFCVCCWSHSWRTLHLTSAFVLLGCSWHQSWGDRSWCLTLLRFELQDEITDTQNF